MIGFVPAVRPTRVNQISQSKDIVQGMVYKMAKELQYNDIIVEDEMSAIESASSSSDMVKESFSAWLSDGHAKKYPAAVYLSCIDKVSAYLIRKKISLVDLWQLTNFDLFKSVYNKAINDKLFKATDKKTYATFVQVGQAFLKYLKSKPVFIKASIQSLEINTYVMTAPTEYVVVAPTKSDFVSMATGVLSSRFANGLRIDSTIELDRFRLFAREDCAYDIKMEDSDLKSVLLPCGIVFEGKLYAVAKKAKTNLAETLSAAFLGGEQIIFFETFYEKNEDWLFDEHIVSADMLAVILKTTCPTYFYNRSNLTVTSDVTLASAVADCFKCATLLDYDQIADLLPYVPIEKIKLVLAQNAEFIWNTRGIYTHISKVLISQTDQADIRAIVDKEVLTHTYLPASQLPMENIASLNPELSEIALRAAVFQMCLADRYDLNGNVITWKGAPVDASILMEQYCLERDSCTLDELLAYEKEICGGIHRWIPMNAAYKTMVRTEENLFIAENSVNFNIDEIDNAIEHFCEGDYIPLQAVTALMTFPYCGHPWTLFLLESFCRRFSRKFRFEVLAVNSKCVGAIVRQSCPMNYRQIMTDAVAKSGIELTEQKVLDYLCNNGYLGRRSLSNADELIREAKMIQERGR